MARTAIVTGSARGIGRAIALRLARDGYDVTINDIAANEAGIHAVVAEVTALGRKAYGHVADVTSYAQVEELVQQSVAHLGPLDTMVANAGIVQISPLLDLTEADMQTMFSVNVFGVQNCYQAAAKQMIAQGARKSTDPNVEKELDAAGNPKGGVYKLIAAASIAGMKSFPMLGHYSASKFAVRGLNQAYAMELAEHGITANAFSPGIVGTAMWDKIDEAMGKKSGAAKGATFKKFGDDVIALKRTSVPEDVASTVSFLASSDSDYMTGQNLVIDGGIMFT